MDKIIFYLRWNDFIHVKICLGLKLEDLGLVCFDELLPCDARFSARIKLELEYDVYEFII